MHTALFATSNKASRQAAEINRLAAYAPQKKEFGRD
jgi:hypothetical protein